MKHIEFNLQKQVSTYLNNNYPDIYFDCDFASHLKLTEGQQRRNKQIQCKKFKRPDLIIYEPNKKYIGLAIELKKETPFKKNGELKSQKVKIYKNILGVKTLVEEYCHLQEQAKSLIGMRNKGYYTCFSWDFDQCKKIIDDYMKNM